MSGAVGPSSRLKKVGSSQSVAGLWFPSEVNAVSNCVPCVTAATRLSLVGSRDAGVDAVEVVADYLALRPDSTVAPTLGRVRLLRPLPKSNRPFPTLQPLRGATGGISSAGQTAPPARH